MGATPDQLKKEIEATRGRLASDVDTLSDKVSPKSVVRRRTARIKRKATSMTSSMKDTAQDGTGSVQQAPSALRGRARGNPLAYGLIAFGTGLLAAAALPTSEKEKELGGQVKQRATGLTEPLKETAKQSAQQLREELEPAAKDAVEQVKGTATGAAQRTSSSAKSSARTVATTAKGSARTTQSKAKATARR